VQPPGHRGGFKVESLTWCRARATFIAWGPATALPDSGPVTWGPARQKLGSARRAHATAAAVESARHAQSASSTRLVAAPGRDVGVDWMAQLDREIAAEERLHFQSRLDQIRSLRSVFESTVGEIAVRPSFGRHPFAQVIESSQHVGMMGTNPLRTPMAAEMTS